MKHRQQRAARHGAWKYLALDRHEYLFDLSTDERERANVAGRYPETLAHLRTQWEQWAAGLPGIPDDAKVNLVCGLHDQPKPFL